MSRDKIAYAVIAHAYKRKLTVYIFIFIYMHASYTYICMNKNWRRIGRPQSYQYRD